MPIKFWLCGWRCCERFGFYNNDTYFVTSTLLGRSGIYLARRGKRIFGSSVGDLAGFKLKGSECRVWRGNAQAMASSLEISPAILSSRKCSLAASQGENQKAKSLRGVCGYGRSSCIPLGKFARTITSQKCLHTNTPSTGNTGRTEGLDICVQSQGHNLAIAETWDSSDDLDAVMDSYVLFRKDWPAK